MCLRFVLMTTLRDVKLHSKERNEDSDRRCLSTGEEDPSVKRQVWLRALISESWGLCSRLGLSTPRGHTADGPPAHAEPRARLPPAPEPSSREWSQREPVLSPARGWEPSTGNAARPANSSTGPCLCSSHHLIIQPALKGNKASQWDPSLPFEEPENKGAFPAVLVERQGKFMLL